MTFTRLLAWLAAIAAVLLLAACGGGGSPGDIHPGTNPAPVAGEPNAFLLFPNPQVQPDGSAANQHACLRAGLLRRHRSEQHQGHARQVEGGQRLRHGNRHAGHRRLRRFARPGLRAADDSAAEPRRHPCLLRRELRGQDGRGIRLFPDQPRGRDRARPELACISQRYRVQPWSGRAEAASRNSSPSTA